MKAFLVLICVLLTACGCGHGHSIPVGLLEYGIEQCSNNGGMVNMLITYTRQGRAGTVSADKVNGTTYCVDGARFTLHYIEEVVRSE